MSKDNKQSYITIKPLTEGKEKSQVKNPPTTNRPNITPPQHQIIKKEETKTP